MASTAVVQPAERSAQQGWLLRRLLSSLAAVWVISVLVFVLANVLPGNAVDQLLGVEATPETRSALERELDLDEPVLSRYWDWLRGLVRLDLGTSIVTGERVSSSMGPAVLNTLLLAALALAVSVPLALALGARAASRPGTAFDRVVAGGSSVLLCVPEFLVGVVLVLVFSVWIPLFPALSTVNATTSVADRFLALVLPALAMAPVGLAYIIRTMRFSTLEVRSQEFVLMASLRGLSARRTFWRHVLPNALVPMINVLCLQFSFVLSGVVAIEALFQYNGLGLLLLDAVRQRDLPLVQATAIIVSVTFVLLSLLSDVLTARLDPRIKR